MGQLKSLLFFIVLVSVQFGCLTFFLAEDPEEIEAEFLEDDRDDETFHIYGGQPRELFKTSDRLDRRRAHLIPPPQSQRPSATVRLEAQRIIKEFSCNQGFSLVGHRCVGSETTQPVVSCPAYTSLRDGKCRISATLQSSCPAGFNKNLDRCERYNVVPATLMCQPGETLTDMSCISEKVVQTSCPDGFTLDGTNCTQKLPAQYRCATGYLLDTDTNKCVNRSFVPATVVCPDGAQLDPDTQKCTIMKQEPPTCPKRFVFSGLANQCIQSVPEVPDKCPPEHLMVGDNLCERRVTHPLHYYCAEGFKLEGAFCIMAIPKAPECPDGFYHSRADQDLCEKIVKEEHRCPARSTLIDHKGVTVCEKQIAVEPVPACPEGYSSENNLCIREETLVPRLSCEGDCYTTKILPWAYACPADAAFVDEEPTPQCVREIQTAGNCLPKDVNPPPHCSATLRHADDAGTLAPECHPSLPRNCEPVISFDRTPAQYFCPEGGEYINGNCQLQTPIVPQKLCDSGTLNPQTGVCQKRITTHPNKVCPAGAKSGVDGCFMTEIMPPESFCPQGATIDERSLCKIRAPVTFGEPELLKLPAMSSCQHGQQLSPDGSECYSITTAEISKICPQGSVADAVPEMTCVIFAPLFVPPPVVKAVKPSYVCPDGSSSQQCLTVNTVDAERICPHNTEPTQDGHSCLRVLIGLTNPSVVTSSVPVPVCPPNFRQKGTLCHNIEKVEVQKSCDERYFQSEGNCIREIEMMKVCPPGSMLSGDGCMKEISRAPHIRIVQGCVHNVTPPPCTECPRSIKSQCYYI